MPSVVGPGTKIANKSKQNELCIHSRVQASIDPIVSHLLKSRMLEIFKNIAKWWLGRLVPCLLPSMSISFLFLYGFTDSKFQNFVEEELHKQDFHPQAIYRCSPVDWLMPFLFPPQSPALFHNG